jgi:uncharacterized DUF497 family protein
VRFRWTTWNVEHLARHGVTPEDAEVVVVDAHRPWPLRRDADKWLVWGRGRDGRQLQVVFVFDNDGSVFVIHGRPLTRREQRRLRRRTR